MARLMKADKNMHLKNATRFQQRQQRKEGEKIEEKEKGATDVKRQK